MVTGNVECDVTGNLTELSMREITSLTSVKRLLSIRELRAKSHTLRMTDHRIVILKQ